MPIKTAPKTYTWENASSAFKTWFKKYFPGIDYNTLYSEDKALIRGSFDKGLKPIGGHLTATKAQRDAIRKSSIDLIEFVKKAPGVTAPSLRMSLYSNPDRVYNALKTAGIDVTMIGDRYRFSNLNNSKLKKFSSAFVKKFAYSDAQLNQAAQTIYEKPYYKNGKLNLTKNEASNIRSRLEYTGGNPLKKRTVFTPLPEGSQIKVLQEFPDAKFDLSKYGYDSTTAKGKSQNIVVKNYINRGFKLRNFTPLSRLTQNDIKKKFTEIKDWDFKRFKYGIPGGGKKETSALVQRIRTFASDPKPWRYGFQLNSPGSWMLAQMDRAITDHGNTRFESILKDGRVIGMKDNGVAYYANRNVAPGNASKLITSHPNFVEVQKFVDIANKANTPLIKLKDAPSRALVELFPEGFNAKNLSLNRLLSYTYQHKGLEVTKAALQKHHIDPLKAMGDPINVKNLQLLRRDLNVLGESVDKSIRGTARKLSTLERVPELTEAGVKIKVGDVVYGGGTQDPTKVLRQETEALYEPLSKYKPKDWSKLQTWLVKSFNESPFKNQRRTAIALNCPFTKAEGGRIGYALGSATINCVNTKLTNDPIQSSLKLRATEGIGKVRGAATNFLKLLGRGGARAAPLAALAAAGAAVEPLVKQFRNDDPNTYLTNEGQMKGMLLATIEGETPKVDEELLKWQYPGMAASAAAAIPGSSALMKARKAKGFGTPRAALGPVGKFLAGTFSPLGVAATLPISVAAQRKGGTEWGDIATDPLNWMAPAFASTGARMATRGMAPTGILSKAIRMGISPRTLSLVSRRFGMPGLAISAGMWGYDKWKNRSVNDED